MNDAKGKQQVDQAFQRWNAWLLGFLETRMRVKEDARDLAQEVYLRLLRSRSPEPIRHPQAYLATVASHVLDEWRQQASQAKPHTEEGLADLEAGDDLELTVEIEALQQRVRQALQALPPIWRAVLVLRFREELTYEETAKRLGVSRRMVKRYLANAYARLRVELVDDDRSV